jgi:lysozyme family protein
VEAWKVKAKFSIRTILKKNSTKIILKKKHVEKHCSKTKIMWGNIVAIHNVFF